MIGQTLGSYTLERELGRGGMGAVYTAVHALLGRRAAVKVLRPELSRDDATVQRFFNEARAASAIKHPSIVEIYDFGVAPDGAAYIVMELLDGESLATRLARLGRLPVTTALVLARQIANALAVAHKAGIVHRDLKPDNAFLVADPEVAGGERVKLLDFGIAKLVSGAIGAAHTTTGAIMGTPHYMSPEQCEGSRAVDHRADLYSLGCMLFQMITGRLPFEGDGVGGIIGMHLYVAPPALRSLAPDAPAAVEALVARLLAKDPAARPATAEDTAAQLAALGADSGAPVPTARPTPPPAAAAARVELGAAATLPHTPAGPVHGPAPTVARADATLAAPPPTTTPAPPTRRTGWWIAGAALVVGGGAIAALVATGGGAARVTVDAAVGVVDATPADASADALVVQAQTAIAERRWADAVVLAQAVAATGHPLAMSIADQARRGKAAADAVAAMQAALAAHDYHAVRVALDVVYDNTLDGDPDRGRADDVVAQARIAAVEAARTEVDRLVRRGACQDARTVAAQTAADWGADGTRKLTDAAARCKSGQTGSGDVTTAPPADPLATQAAAIRDAVRGGRWQDAVVLCESTLDQAPAAVRTALAVPCATAACNSGAPRLAARAIRLVPPPRRPPVIQICIDHRVLLPLDLITPARPPGDRKP